MKQDWLEDLIALLDTGSVVHAAAARNISQPAFTRRVQSMESILGVEIIDRTVKPHLPAVALRMQSEKIRELAYQQKQLLKQIQIEGRAGAKLLVVASQHAIITASGHLIMKALSNEGSTHVRMRSGNLNECQVMLLTEKADISLSYKTAPGLVSSQQQLIAEHYITEETLIPVYATSNLEALKSSFASGELDMIGYPSDVFLGTQVNEYVLPELESQCQLNIITETALSPAALQLAEAAVGLAWVPQTLAAPRLKDGSLTDLGDQFGTVQMHVVVQHLQNKKKAKDLAIWSRKLKQVFTS